jgi:hypothetical protein
MHKRLLKISVFFLGIAVIFTAFKAHAEDHGNSIALVLNSAEKFFISLKNHEYETAWNFLSEKSHKTIIDDVYKAYGNMGGQIKKEDVKKDFRNRGVMFNNYWKAFLDSFNTDMILEHSQWEMGAIKKTRAEILLINRKTHSLARLKMYKEQGVWKIGLVETFWTRKTVKFLQPVFRYLH